MKLIPDFTKRLHEETLSPHIRDWFIQEKSDFEWYLDIYKNEHKSGIGTKTSFDSVLKYHFFEFLRRLRTKYFMKSSYKGNKKYREDVLKSFPFLPCLESLHTMHSRVHTFHTGRNAYERVKTEYPPDLASSDLFKNMKIDEIGEYEIERPEDFICKN